MERRFAKHSPYFVQVLPKLELARIRAKFCEVAAQKHLAILDYGTILVGVLGNGSFITGAASDKSSRGDVVLQQLFVHDIDECWNKGFDVFGAGCESFDVAWEGLAGCTLNCLR